MSELTDHIQGQITKAARDRTGLIYVPEPREPATSNADPVIQKAVAERGRVGVGGLGVFRAPGDEQPKVEDSPDPEPEESDDPVANATMQQLGRMIENFQRRAAKILAGTGA